MVKITHPHMSKTSNTDNAWSETGDNAENNNTGNFQDNKYINERREDRNYERRDDPNNERNGGYSDNRGDDRKKYDGREDNMRARYGEPRHDRSRFEERRRYEPRDYDMRDERIRMRYPERRVERFDDRRRFDSRGYYYGAMYDDRRYGDSRGYRGEYDEGRYGGCMYNRPSEYGRRIDHGRMGGDGFGGPGYGMPRRSNFANRSAKRQDDAPPNLTIALFNLRRDTTKDDFDNAVNSVLKEEIKTEYSTKIILDRNTGKCRGYGFVTFENLDESIKAKKLLDNLIIVGNAVRVAFSIDDDTQKKEMAKEENKKTEMEEGELKKEKEESVEKNDD